MDFEQTGQPDYSYQRFAFASLICGILSILLSCTGVLALPLGALGILFALLPQRKGRDMSTYSITGLAVSCAGLLFGVIMCVYAVYLIQSDPKYREIYENSYNYYYEEFFTDL